MSQYVLQNYTKTDSARMISPRFRARRITKISMKWEYDLWWLVRTPGISEKDEMVRNMCT
jgi:hypothetical protein